MSKITSLLAVCLAAVFLSAGLCRAAQITDIQVFSEDDYVRVAITLDQPVKANVEINAGEKLVFVRFDKAGIENLSKQSFLYENDPHLESVTFLPLGTETTVLRVKARHPFKVKTREIKNPPRFILELSERTPFQQTGLGGSMLRKGYYAQGVSQMQKGNYNSALMSFRSAIRAGNRVADSYYQAGLIRYKFGQTDKALINFNRAQKSSSFGDDARLYLSWIHYGNGDYTSLAGSWKNFISNLPDENERMSLVTGHPEIDYRALEEDAKNELNKLARKVSASSAIQNNVASNLREAATVYFAKGLVAKEEGNLEEAAQLLEKAISLDSSYTEAHFQLGVIYKDMGRTKISVHHFEKSIGSGGGLRQKSGEPVKNEEESLPGGHERLVLDLEPVTEDAAQDNPGDKEQVSAAPAGLISKGGSGGASEAQPGKIQASQARDETSMLISLRQTVADVIALPNAGLLRRQVKILTIILGVLFLLTVVGEKVALRKSGKPESVVPNLIMEDRLKSNPGSQDTGIGRPLAPNVEKKRQMEVVLARELAAKRRASQPVIGATESELELHLQPVGERGMYGADIAKRIKEELSRADRPESFESVSTPFGRKRDDLQTRLIRQLRSKNWTISDIAQEMDLSREEIKWALAGNSEAKETQVGKTSGKTLGSRYGQARSLLGRKKKDYQGIKPESIDREVDLELEINV